MKRKKDIQQEIWDATRLGDNDTLNKLLQKGCGIDLHLIKGEEEFAGGEVSLLHLASHHGHTNTVSLLLSKGAKPNARTLRRTTPLMIACEKGHNEIVRILAENQNVQLNAKDVSQATALHYASSALSTETVAALLDNGAKINLQDRWGATALHYAIDSELVSVHSLMTPGPVVDTVRLLLDGGVAINATGKFGWTGLQLAAHKAYFGVVKLLVDSGVDVNITARDGSTALLNALYPYWGLHGENNPFKNMVEIVKYLVLNGARTDIVISQSGSFHLQGTPLNHVVFMIHADRGVERAYLECLEFLLQNGANCNLADHNGRTPLHVAFRAFPDEVERKVLEILIQHGANINATDIHGNTPLHTAVWRRHKKEFIQFLLENGADINAKDFVNGNTPLHTAVCNISHNVEQVDFLVSNAASVTAKDKHGNTPLVRAALANKKDIVLYLLRKSGQNYI